MTAPIRAEVAGDLVRRHVAGVVVDIKPTEADQLARVLRDAAWEADATWCRRVNAGAPKWGERIEWTDIIRPGLVFVGKVTQVHRGLIYVRLPHPSPLNGGGDTTVFPVNPDGSERRWRVVDEDGHRCAVCAATDTVLTGPARECAPGNGCTETEPGNVAAAFPRATDDPLEPAVAAISPEGRETLGNAIRIVRAAREEKEAWHEAGATSETRCVCGHPLRWHVGPRHSLAKDGPCLYGQVTGGEGWGEPRCACTGFRGRIVRRVEGEGTMGGRRDGVRCRREAQVDVRLADVDTYNVRRHGVGAILSMARFDVKDGRWSAWSSDDIDGALIVNHDEIAAVVVDAGDLEVARAAFHDAPFPVEAR